MEEYCFVFKVYIFIKVNFFFFIEKNFFSLRSVEKGGLKILNK